MKSLLAEYLRNILVEESKPIEKGEGVPQQAVGKFRGKFGNVYADPQLTQYLGKIRKGQWIPAAQAAAATGDEEPDITGAKPPTKDTKTSGKAQEPATPQMGVYGKDPSQTNAESVLQREIREGHIGNPPPGNEFSHYQEPVSVVVARWIIDNPDATDQEIMEHLTSVDCGGVLVSKNVSSTLPKEYNSQFKELKAGGAFSNQCSESYSDGTNKARFMTMIMAKNKAERMKTAIINNNLSGVQFDSFSGDQNSLSTMRSFFENLPDGTRIGTETGEEITKEEALKYMSGFGTSRFPADTAMIGQSPTGEVVFMGFSDKKDLKAIINNSTVSYGIRRNQELLSRLVDRNIISKEQQEKISADVSTQADEYERIEEELKVVTTLPATKLLEILEKDISKAKGLIKKVKTMSSGKDPAKYWNKRIKNVFEGAASGKGTHKSKAKYLEMAGWSNGDKLTDEIMLKAFTYMSKEILEGDGNLPKEDQEILYRMEVIDNKQLVETVGNIRDRSLAVLENMRNSLNEVQLEISEGKTIQLGTYLDAMDAWHSLHFDMKEYKGSLSMAAGDQIVDYKDIEECLGGISDHRTFAETLSIETRTIRDQTYGEYTTGQNIEVFAFSPSGEKINVGVRTIRSKDGILGKLQTTFNYHPDYQKCLSGKKINKD